MAQGRIVRWTIRDAWTCVVLGVVRAQQVPGWDRYAMGDTLQAVLDHARAWRRKHDITVDEGPPTPPTKGKVTYGIRLDLPTMRHPEHPTSDELHEMWVRTTPWPEAAIGL